MVFSDDDTLYNTLYMVTSLPSDKAGVLWRVLYYMLL